MRHSLAIWALTILVSILGSSCADNLKENAENNLTSILAEYERELVPIRKEQNLQSFIAISTGKHQAYEKAAEFKNKEGDYFSAKNTYKILEQIVKQKLLNNPKQMRQATLLYYEYLQHQAPTEIRREIIDLEKNLKQNFTQFRVSFQGKKLSDVEVREIFMRSKSKDELQELWKASKQIGGTISEDLIKLVKLRNKAAQALGFDTYFEMQLFVSDLDPRLVDSIFNELDILTRGPYTQLKADIDKYLMKLYKVSSEELRPWHYQDLFFQNAPAIKEIDYDRFYTEKNVVELGAEFYRSLGFDVDHLIRSSDLLPKDKKSQMGITKNIDYEGDVRISMNIKSDEYSMNLFLYEMGFALYLKNISNELSYVLRRPAHFFTTDAVAIMFSSLSTHPVWLSKIEKLPQNDIDKLHRTYKEQQRLQKFVFSRWAQVVYRFEKALYEDPSQDLNNLWWQLVENYQLVKRPEGRNEPDWATKEHLVALPCKYQNYLLGELMAAQLFNHISKSILPDAKNMDSLDLHGKKVLGEYLRKEVFFPGALYHWQDLTKRVTGEELNPDYFYQQYIK